MAFAASLFRLCSTVLWLAPFASAARRRNLSAPGLAPYDPFAKAKPTTTTPHATAPARVAKYDPFAKPKKPEPTPDPLPYDPVDLLCRRGQAIEGWCKDWLACIKSSAEPAGDQAAVMKAWAPADCKEVCGVWPVTTGMEGGNATALLRLGAGRKDDPECLESCANFQKSLSSCVAMILFEPGKVANMKDVKVGGLHASSFCTAKDTKCLPNLPVESQKCLLHKTKKYLDKDHVVPVEWETHCKSVEIDLEDCKDCPQLHEEYTGHYHSFVGGCMDQLNAYWQATHPAAGKGVAIPGAAGCTVH